jgi:hypothetical protein
MNGSEVETERNRRRLQVRRHVRFKYVAVLLLPVRHQQAAHDSTHSETTYHSFPDTSSPAHPSDVDRSVGHLLG